MPTRLATLVFTLLAAAAATAAPLGYYRQPAIHGDMIVFVSEGDLWRVPIEGGAARRLTSHPSEETSPALSPDGATVAFIGRYEGPAEVYTMPAEGGRPVRRTWSGAPRSIAGWTPGGEVVYATRAYSTLPDEQLVRLDITRDDVAAPPTVVPLAQAAEGSWVDDAADRGRTLFFTRLPFQGSHTKRYRGGTAQQIWRFADGDAEATLLTGDYPGTSKSPMWWRGRIYFASDRDDTMNLWSVRPDGTDPRQHTRHAGWEVKSPRLAGGRIVYQHGADLRIYDIAADRDAAVPITLVSDLDQTREQWIDDPLNWVTAAHPSPDGSRVVLTVRGRVFVAPHRQGRLVEASRRQGVRYRAARFMPDGEKLVTLSDESGEVEIWTLPANGVGENTQITSDGEVLRWQAVPSPDGRLIAHWDKNFRLFIHDVEAGSDRRVDTSEIDDFQDITWSPDSRWLAYVAWAPNQFRQIRLYDVEGERIVNATSDRYDSYSPAWAPDRAWLYMLSDRNLASVVGSPWGNYQPEPFLDKKGKVYMLALREGLRSPFAPMDELHGKDADADADTDTDAVADAVADTDADADTDTDADTDADADADTDADADADADRIAIDTDGLATRLYEVPAPAGNYNSLSVNDKGLFWLSRDAGAPDATLQALPIKRIDAEVTTFIEKVDGYEMAADGKTLLVRKGDAFHLVAAQPKKADLDKTAVNLSGWKLSIVPREEWRQMFVEAWRLERDYFYDRDMHGVDWDAMLERYWPLVDRVTTRDELSDLTAQMVSELAALHIYVRSGETRTGPDNIRTATLGARLRRDEAAGGYRVEHVYRSDPDTPERRSPLAAPDVNVVAGDVIEMINGTPTLAVPDIGVLLRDQAGRQVLARVRSGENGDGGVGGGAGDGDGEGDATRDVIIVPMTAGAGNDLRYHEWEYTRRLAVEEKSEGQIGYVHLRAMGGRNFTEWARDYYPVFTRGGLIIDVRHNRGGNIDSWIIGRLLRKAWFYWSQRVGQAPIWNMQQAFRGHIAVLCNEWTASDGEAFTEGVKRLDLGRVFGTRTWGGEIWLSSSNRLVDRGIATAAEYGVYGPEGEWLIEGHGVEPDVVVDNLPHATFNGRDAQLEAAIAYLRQKMRDEPVAPLPPPAYPDKSAPDNRP